MNWREVGQGFRMLGTLDGWREAGRQARTKQFWTDFGNTVVHGSEAIAGAGLALAQPELAPIVGEALGVETTAGVSEALVSTARITGSVGKTAQKLSDNKSSTMEKTGSVMDVFESLGGHQLSGFNTINRELKAIQKPLNKVSKALDVIGLGDIGRHIKQPLSGIPSVGFSQTVVGLSNKLLEEEAKYLKGRYNSDVDAGHDIERYQTHPVMSQHNPIPDQGFWFAQLNNIPQMATFSDHPHGTPAVS